MTERATDIEIAQSLLKEIGRESLLAYFDKRLRVGKEVESRPLLLMAYARLAGAQSKELLVSVVNDGSEFPRARVAAARALGQLIKQSTKTVERSEVTSSLVKLLGDSNSELRSAVAIELSRLQAQEAAELLKTLLQEDKLDLLAREEVQKFLSTLVTTSPYLPPIPIHSFIGRRRELRSLQEAFGHSQIAIVAGMGGIGKTSLAATFARESDYEVKVWRSCKYSLDPADLANGVLLQLTEQLSMDQSPHREPLSGPHFDWDKIQEQTVNLLLNRSSLVVLDDFEEVREDNELSNFIEALVARLPRFNCLIVGRIIPNTMRGTVIRMEGLSPDDSYDVLRAAANQRNIHLDSNAARTITQLADGNALVLNLYISALSEGLTVDQVLHTDTEEVVSSIINRSLEKLSSSQRRALEILSQFQEPISPNDPETNQLFIQEGVGEFSEFLPGLTRLSFVALDSQGFIVLHGPVRQLIGGRTDKRTILRVNNSLGAFYKKRGNVLRAAAHFIRGELFEDAVLVLHDHLGEVINQGHARNALETLNSIAATELESSLKMRLFSSVGFLSRFLGLNQKAITSYEQALTVACETSDRRAEVNILGNLGRIYSVLGEIHRAVDYQERRLAIARDNSDHKGEVGALSNLGHAYLKLGDTHRAIECFEQQLAITRELGDQRGEGGALGSLGRVYAHIGETGRAIEYYERRLSITRQIGDRFGEATALGSLGRGYANMGETARAIESHEKRLSIVRELGDRRGEGAALSSLGRLYAELGEFKQAIDYYKNRLTIAREIGDPKGEATALGNLGRAHMDIGDTPRSIEFHEQALHIIQVIGERRAEGKALMSLGRAYATVGDPQRAIEFFEQALHIVQLIEDRRSEGTVLSNLGRTYADIGDQVRAVDFYQQALQIMRLVEDRRSEGTVLSNLGRTYADIGDQVRAVECYQESLQIMQMMGDRRGEAKILSSLGDANAQMGDRPRAIELFEHALQIMQLTGDRRGEAKVLKSLGALYEEMGQESRATELFEQALRIMQLTGDRRGEAKVLNSLGSAHAAIGDAGYGKYFEQALQIMKLLGDRRGEGNTLYELSLATYKLGNIAQARSYAQDALNILERMEDPIAVEVRKTIAVWPLHG